MVILLLYYYFIFNIIFRYWYLRENLMTFQVNRKGRGEGG